MNYLLELSSQMQKNEVTMILHGDFHNYIIKKLSQLATSVNNGDMGSNLVNCAMDCIQNVVLSHPHKALDPTASSSLYMRNEDNVLQLFFVGELFSKKLSELESLMASVSNLGKRELENKKREMELAPDSDEVNLIDFYLQKNDQTQLTIEKSEDRPNCSVINLIIG